MSKTTDSNAERLMRRALALAWRGQGRVEPNPMVGCVIARGGEVLAQGYHRRFGGDHAEVDALRRCRQGGIDPAGCDVYVNLEPCCHHAKTPPCTDALIDAKVARVYIAQVDPCEHVAGRGLEQLRAAGIEVITGICRDNAQQVNAPYVKRVRSGLPWVIAKWAQTADGAIATAQGDSRWISGKSSRRYVHQLRARVDAVIVGIGTVLADDPLLSARDVPVRRVARRVVIDPQLRLPADARLVQTMGPKLPLTVAVHQTVLAAPSNRVTELAGRGVEFVGLAPCGDNDRQLQLQPLLAHLAEARSATNVLVEGGGGLIGALLQQELIDQVLTFVAPKLLGDDSAKRPVCGMTAQRITQARPMTLHGVKRIGDDVLLDYRM